MIKRILTICTVSTAALAAGVAGTSLALAQGYPPVPPGAVYSAAPPPYPTGGYPPDYRRGPGVPDFDMLEDDEAPNSRNSAALPRCRTIRTNAIKVPAGCHAADI